MTLSSTQNFCSTIQDNYSAQWLLMSLPLHIFIIHKLSVHMCVESTDHICKSERLMKWYHIWCSTFCTLPSVCVCVCVCVRVCVRACVRVCVCEQIVDQYIIYWGMWILPSNKEHGGLLNTYSLLATIKNTLILHFHISGICLLVNI